MADRYFLEAAPTGDQATLSGSEAHHLAHVMRARAGDEVLLFDGSGVEYSARVEQVGRSEIRLAVIARRETNVELAVALQLGVALSKGDRQRWLVEKSVELGVSRMAPLITERGVAQPTGSAVGRLRRAVIEASKQCGRNRLMEIAEPLPLAEFLLHDDGAALKLLAHPGGAALQTVLTNVERTVDSCPILLAVGPEGGFADNEISLARERGWQTIGLGTRTLRVETAALALAAAIGAHFDAAP